MKIISGFLRGRTLLGFDIDGTRPTMDRVKESLFAMIQSNIQNSIVLDLFAGTGNYGIEALSNGASFVYFNDHNHKCITVIKKNLEKLQIEKQTRVINNNYLKCLDILTKENVKFDLIFLDPPYNFKELSVIIEYIINNHMLNNNGLIIIECEVDNLKDCYNNLIIYKKRAYGMKKIIIYKKIEGDKDEIK